MSETGLSWFKDARWGMFFHLGLYTLLGENENAARRGSKTTYAKLMQQFTIKKFDPDAWIDCAASMGARYIVPTARHGEGFCLWDSQLTRYKVTHTPCGRDVIAELAQACAKRNDIKFALYFNWETWLNEGVNDDIWNQKGLTYPEFMEGQLTELLTHYGPIALIWFDHSHPTLTRKNLISIHRTIKRLQPDCLVNNRGQTHGAVPLGDFLTPEREFPDSAAKQGLTIECCDSMGVRSWGYCVNDAFWSTPTLASRTSECASKGYNYLLNVEPAPDGTIRRECVSRAKALGNWIRRNQDALTASPSSIQVMDPNIQEEPVIGNSTQRGRTLYLHLHQWPVSSEIRLPVTGTLKPGRLTAHATERGLLINRFSASAPAGPSPWIIPLEFIKPPKALTPPSACAIEHDPAGTFFLSPDRAAVSTKNGIIIPKLNRFPDGVMSMGSLHRIGDTLTWHVNVPEERDYDITLSLGSIARQDAAGFELSSPVATIQGRTWLTDHYSKPTRKTIGRLRLPAGPGDVTLRVTEVPNGSFSDLHGIWLTPVK